MFISCRAVRCSLREVKNEVDGLIRLSQRSNTSLRKAWEGSGYVADLADALLFECHLHHHFPKIMPARSPADAYVQLIEGVRNAINT